ncbi:hypothetical protein DFH06DRAFT_1349296 [Mycena polygramma]|nr:hypothetical protein DFH06DRAFT_1349296 [Mycena polygramma]
MLRPCDGYVTLGLPPTPLTPMLPFTRCQQANSTHPYGSEAPSLSFSAHWRVVALAEKA